MGKNIFLIGMMGSGKTVTARELAKTLGMKAIDLDELIEARTGKSINAIFEQDGEPAFREVETKLLFEVSLLDGQVVGTGGGIVLQPGNIKRMREQGTVIYLKTNLDVLWDRVKSKKDRPLLKTDAPRRALEVLYESRAPFYEMAAHHAVMTDGKTARQVAHEITEKFFK